MTEGLSNALSVLPKQIDIGFGDVIVPEPKTISYPTILGFPAPELKGYTMESTIAEKKNTDQPERRDIRHIFR